MANEEILELKIRDNAAETATALSNLATALTGIKTAVGRGLNMTGTVNALERLKNAITVGLNDEHVARFERLASTLERLRDIGALRISGIRNIANQLNGTEAEATVNGAMDGIVSAVDRGMETVESRTGTAAESIGSPFTSLNNRITDTYFNIRTVVQNINDSLQTIGRASFAHLQSGFQSLVTSVGNVSRAVGGMLGSFLRIAKYRFIRSVIKNIMEAFSTGVENVYHYSQAINSEFAPAMDSAASALKQMKNSIGAAVAPLLQSLIPILNQIVYSFIEVVNWVNQFIALLRGQSSWTRAVPQTVKAFDDQKKAAKGASGAVKELLADWDELNIIQSETSGGGGGGSTKKAEDYLHMFEEVNEFDSDVKKVIEFIQDHMGQIKTLAEEIGLAILGWKLSNLFTGWLGTLATLATVGLIVKLSADVTTLLDEAYVETENKSFLLADTIVTAALAGIAGHLAEAKLGSGFGLITGGIIFAVSAGATFHVASGVGDEAKQKMLEMLGGVKWGIAAALVTAGFIRGGFGFLKSLAMGVFSATIVTWITYELKVKAQKAQEAADMAKEAFAATGEGSGINPQEYIDALQKEFDLQTAGASLVLKAYVEVPDLQNSLREAGFKIAAFNSLIFKGDGKLSKEDAQSFKENWGTVIETLNQMNAKSYETILEGLTSALNSKSAELRQSAEEIRTTFIMLEKNLDAEQAEMYKKMQEIVGRLGTEAQEPDDLEEYKKYYNVLAAATDTGLQELNDALEKGKGIDFGDKEHAIENAKQFIEDVGVSANEAINKENEALSAIRDSINMRRRTIQAMADEGLIDENEFNRRKDILDEVERVNSEYTDERIKEIKASTQKAYDIIFQQALSAEGADTDAYWETVLIPLMKQAKEAGMELPGSLRDAYAQGINQNYLDFATPADSFIKALIEQGITDPETIVKALESDISQQYKGKGELWENLISMVLWANPYSQAGLSGVQVEAGSLLEITGWDMFSEEIKQEYVNAFRGAFGDSETMRILSELGVDVDVMDAMFENGDKEVQKKMQELFSRGLDDEALFKQLKSLGKNYGFSPVEFFMQDYEIPDGVKRRWAEEILGIENTVEEMSEDNPVKISAEPFIIDQNTLREMISDNGEPSAIDKLSDDVNKLKSDTDDLGAKIEALRNRILGNTEDATGGVDEITGAVKELGDAVENVGSIDIDSNNIDQIYNELKELINASGLSDSIKQRFFGQSDNLFSNSDIDAMRTLYGLVKEFGVYNGFNSFMRNWDFEGGGGLGNLLNGARQLASAGTSTEGHYAGYKEYTEPQSWTQQSEEQFAANMESSMRGANEPQNEILRTIEGLARTIANKNWVINVTPNSGWGVHNAKSNAAYGRVTGNAMTPMVK